MPLVKGFFELFEFSTDYDPADAGATATWGTINPNIIFVDGGSGVFSPEALTEENANTLPVFAGEALSYSFLVAEQDTNTELDALVTASEGGRVWYRVTPTGLTARTIGGTLGCTVAVARSPLGAAGQIAKATVTGKTVGTTPGSTFSIAPAA